MISLVLAHVLVILIVGGVRFGPEAVLFVPARALWVAAVGAAALGLVRSLFVDRRRGQLPWHDRGRTLLWLVFPGGTALHWGLAGDGPGSAVERPALALVLGLVLAFLFHRRHEWAGREREAWRWRVAARWLALPTALVVAFGLARPPAGSALGLAALTYPAYALAQLGAGLVLPWIQGAHDGVGPRARVLTITLLFGLVHWPNPFATLATLSGMALWASAWRAGSALLPVALSMGLMAATVTQLLPVSLTGHMRVGAEAVLGERAEARSRWLDEESARIEALAGGVEDGLRPWLARALPLATGAPCDSALVGGTADLLERLHRESTLRWIFDSGEFRWRHGIEARLEPAELRFFGSTFAPFHPAHAPYVDLVARGAALPYPEFVELAYRELLGRAMRPAEMRHWPPAVTAGTRDELLRRILDGGGLRARELRHWREPDDPELRRRLRETPAATPR